jgi:ATP-binding protein involved in chromosome partitioning
MAETPAPPLSEASLLAALDEVLDPELGQSLVALGMIQEILIEEGGARVSFACELTTPACPLKDHIEAEIRECVRGHFPQVRDLAVRMTGKVRSGAFGSAPKTAENPIPQVSNLVLIGAGKGGTGKSTVAVNSAAALARAGARTALLDCDFSHPAVPDLLGIRQRPGLGANAKILPVPAHGMETMSMGYLMEPRKPMFWRGPVLQGVISQFLRDVLWGAADYMIVDLPPDSGEMLVDLGRSHPAVCAVLVTTPAAFAVEETARAAALCAQVNVPLLGLVENMSEFVCEECRRRRQVAARGAVRKLAEDLKVPVLGEIPIEPACGTAEVTAPLVVALPESAAAKAFVAAAAMIAAEISQRHAAAQRP